MSFDYYKHMSDTCPTRGIGMKDSRPIIDKRIKSVCSWCDKILREGPPGIVTHGICKSCSDKMLAKVEESRK